MTFPIIAANDGETGANLGNDNPQPTPTGVGDLAIYFVTLASPGVGDGIGGSLGWTELFDEVIGTSQAQFAAYARVLDGTSKDTLSLTGRDQDYITRYIRISGHGVTNPANDLFVATPDSGSSANADPPSLDAGSAADYLWVAACGIGGAITTSFSGVPAGYTDVYTDTVAADGEGLGIASLDLNASSEDPGTFSHTNRPWVAVTIAVAPGGGGFATKVGSAYEIGLDGTGYMLADNPSRPVTRQIGVLETQPPGSDDPLSERIGRYNYIGQSDWTGGEGQELLDRPASDVTRYFYSEGIDPFEPGRITALPATSLLVTDTYVGQETVAVDDRLYVITGTAELTEVDEDGVTTAFNPGLAGTPSTTTQPLASDGEFWYITDGATIRRNNTAADPLSDWSVANVHSIAWCTDRLAGLDSVANPNEFVHFSPTGVETVQQTHPGADLRGVAGGDGFIWYGVHRGATGEIWYWQVDSDPENAGIALSLPSGEAPWRLFYYLGNIFIVVSATTTELTSAKIYRCAHNGDGRLVPQVVLDEGLDSGTPFGFAGRGKFVAFGWPGMQRSGENGIGVLDLETGGVARWHAGTGTTAANVRVADLPWASEDFAFAIDGEGLYGRTASEVEAPTYRSGFLESSTSDLASSSPKLIDELLVSTLPLPTSGGAAASVSTAYSVDGGAGYTTLAAYNTPGETQHSTALEDTVVTPSVRTRVRLDPTGDATDKPTVTALVAKTHFTGIVDEVIEIPINCEDYIADVNDTTIAEDSGPGKGMDRFRALQALVGKKVSYQDVDAKVTGASTTVEVVGVESTSVQVFNQNRNVNDVASHVAIVSLRRAFTA